QADSLRVPPDAADLRDGRADEHPGLRDEQHVVALAGETDADDVAVPSFAADVDDALASPALHRVVADGSALAVAELATRDQGRIRIGDDDADDLVAVAQPDAAHALRRPT